ncbi:hypothetical protein FNH04_29130, partial [Streptomyces phyllanthi]
MVRFSIGDTMGVETAGAPLEFTPRFDITGPAVTVAEYSDMAGRERLLGWTFGSTQWLWAETDDVHFDADSRELAGVRFAVPTRSTTTAHRLPDGPPIHPSGLRADSTHPFDLPQTTVFHYDPEPAELRCAQTPDLLAAVPDARIGIARDLTLLVHEGRMTGWTLTNAAHHLTHGLTDPDP